MKYQFYTADVFTTQIFSGVQIAVFPSADGLTDNQMRSIAREFITPEVVFVFSSQNANCRRIRMFNSLGELNFGSHSIVATAYVLANIGDIQLEGEHTKFVFDSKSGEISVAVTQKDGKPVLTQISFAITPKVDSYVPTEAEIADILSIDVNDIENKKYQTLLVSCGTPYLIVPLRRYELVRKAKFSYRAWSRSQAPTLLAQELLVFSPVTSSSKVNFHARLFGPSIGVNDDPPIGAAIPAFVGFLCAHKHVRKGPHTFVAERGISSGRVSTLNVEMDNLQQEQIKIRVGGPAVMVAQGTIEVPEETTTQVLNVAAG